jgi:hypothetical protein
VKHLFGFLVASVGCLMLPIAAAAQDDAALARTGLFTRDRNITVSDRPRPEYTALPIPIGGFLLTPTIGASVEYNDNIYAAPTGAASDEIFRVQPGVVLTSNWGRHLLSMFARATANEYVDHSTESTTTWATGANGRLDIEHDWGVALGASYERDTEPRTSSGSPATAKTPVQYDLGDLNAETTKAFDRLRLTARVDLQTYSYENVYSDQNAIIYQLDRDNLVETGALKAEYAVQPGFSLFTTIAYNARGFDHRLSTEPTRNSQGYEADVGTSLDLTHLLRGEIYLGYLDQNYTSSAYKNLGGLSLRGTLYYLPTQLTTVSLSGSRSVINSDIIGQGGYLSSNYVVQVDHELFRNIILTASVAIGNDYYEGVDRVDDRLIGSAGATYLLTRTLAFNATYSHYNQLSTGVAHGTNFNVDSLLAALRYQIGG